MRWRSSAYISPQMVDHDDAPEEDEDKGTTQAKKKDMATAEEEFEYVPRANDRVVCLMDIAKPARRKGETCSMVSALLENKELKPHTVKKHRFHAVARSESVMSFSDIGDLESVITEEWEALSELCEEDETFSLIGEEEEENAETAEETAKRISTLATTKVYILRPCTQHNVPSETSHRF